MAIVAGEGVATEACRVLFRNAEKGDYQLFSLHDADPWGYNIARDHAGGDRRMPGYNVNVCDIGLKLKDALALGLEPENATQEGVPERIGPLGPGARVLRRPAGHQEVLDLSAGRIERLHRTGTHRVHREPVASHGVRGKVIPPAKQLPELTEPIVRQVVGDHVYAVIHRLVSAEAIARQIAEGFLETSPVAPGTTVDQGGLRPRTRSLPGMPS